MPSFDIVSEVDNHELTNAVDQANREISTRFDFKGIKASFELQKDQILLTAESDFQVKQMQEILFLKCTKREIDVACLDAQEIKSNLAEARQEIKIKQGIDKDIAKKIIKQIKDNKLKVQAAIQGEQIRVTGKKRDDLQETIQFLRGQDFNLPLQFNNFRD